MFFKKAASNISLNLVRHLRAIAQSRSVGLELNLNFRSAASTPISLSLPIWSNKKYEKLTLDKIGKR